MKKNKLINTRFNYLLSELRKKKIGYNECIHEIVDKIERMEVIYV